MQGDFANLIYIGIDGGGSSTRALITDSDSNPIGYGESGPCNPNTVGHVESANQIDHAFRAAAEKSKRDIIPTAAHFGIAGVGNQEVADALKNELRTYAWFPESKFEITHDLACALEGGLAGQPGIVLVSGTGSAAFGKNAVGDSARASGRDLGEDDPGSGYAIGLEALSRLRSKEPADLLRETASKHFTSSTLEKLANNKRDRASIAQLAPIVIRGAQVGDAWCLHILDKQATRISKLVTDVAQRLFPKNDTFDIVFQGSLISNPSIYQRRLSAILAAEVPQAMLRTALASSVEGACVLARAVIDNTFDRKAALQTLAATPK